MPQTVIPVAVTLTLRSLYDIANTSNESFERRRYAEQLLLGTSHLTAARRAAFEEEEARRLIARAASIRDSNERVQRSILFPEDNNFIAGFGGFSVRLRTGIEDARQRLLFPEPEILFCQLERFNFLSPYWSGREL